MFSSTSHTASLIPAFGCDAKESTLVTICPHSSPERAHTDRNRCSWYDSCGAQPLVKRVASIPAQQTCDGGDDLPDLPYRRCHLRPVDLSTQPRPERPSYRGQVPTGSLDPDQRPEDNGSLALPVGDRRQ